MSSDSGTTEQLRQLAIDHLWQHGWGQLNEMLLVNNYLTELYLSSSDPFMHQNYFHEAISLF